MNDLLLGAYIFVLAIFVGNEVISKVPTTLHTPLMSGANAIHGIIIVGAMLVATAVPGPLGTVLGFLGVILGTINVVGGFVMTAMPQMVAIFNGAGGGAAALVSIQEYLRADRAPTIQVVGLSNPLVGESIAILLGLMIGAVSFSGSAVAFGKLQGVIDARAFKYAGQQIVTGGLFIGMIAGSLALVGDAAGLLSVSNELV